MQIGNIYNYDLEIPYFFNKVKNIENDKLTLIVGWKKAKEFHPDMSILDWKINESVYWTVEPFEDKIAFEKNLAKFKDVCIDNIISEYTYEYVDLMLNPAPQLDLSTKSIILLRSNIFYIKNFKNIYGISLELSTHLNLSLKNQLLNQKVEIEEDIQDKFDVDDRFLVCFL